VPSGEHYEVEAGESLLDGALRAGLNLPHSCKGGRCGSCRARLLRGEVHYPRGRPAALTEAEERAGDVLICQARAVTPVALEIREVREVSDVQIKSLPARVQRMRLLAPSVMGLWLKLPAIEPLNWLPGQYVDVMLSGGRRRSFSLANPPHDGGLLELHVRRTGRGEFTRQVFESMSEGTLLRIEGPLGQFVLREGTGPILLVGGGTGYAPLKAILRHAIERGVGRPVTLFWGARTRDDLYEDAWLAQLAAEQPLFSYVPVLSEEHASPGYASGLAHEAIAPRLPSLAGWDVYAAGPPAMVEAVCREAANLGADPARVFFDSFEYAPDTIARLGAGKLED
jgi:CDP-4-dehydro-6-deoxyglucose reductase